MAKLDSAFKFTGSLGDVTAVKRHDSDEYHLQYKGGPTKDQIETLPNFARTRENNSEFAGVAATVRYLRSSLHTLRGCEDSRVTSRFTKICKSLQLADTDHGRGERAVLFSKFGKWLKGFELNKNVSLNSAIQIPEFTISKQHLSARIVLPELIPGVNFSNPWRQPNYRVVALLSALPDMIHSENGYTPANSTIHFDTAKTFYATNFFGSNLVFNGATIDLQLNGIVPDASTSLVLAVGVQFANEQPAGTTLVKRAACGRILSIV